MIFICDNARKSLPPDPFAITNVNCPGVEEAPTLEKMEP